MPINYGGLFPGPTADTVKDPQKLFQALPGRAKKYAYLRDVQGEVLGKWVENADHRDTVIKMNTGSGKTVVGLLVLKSCINAGAGPAVYVSPDNYLCSQVCDEASDLGLATTTDPRSIEYRTGKAILVIPIHTLVNGKSKFGIGNEVKIPIGSIVIDDAHACLATAEEQFTLRLPRSHVLFKEVFALFRDDLRSQSLSAAIEIERGDPRGLLPVPYWAWMDKQEQLITSLSEHQSEDELKFVWPLLRDDLAFCRCFFSSSMFEISSRCLPIDSIPSFMDAKRRIYMTATLADDAILVTDFGADASAVSTPIAPKTASDLGERMILVPQEINPIVTDNEIKSFVARYKRKHNVVVIVPSKYRADFWSDVATPNMILTTENIHDGIEKLRRSTGNLAILVNKYDGIDLPQDACRILVVDGLPDARRLLDRFEQGALKSSERLNVRQIQRIEQGMGRAIRSNDDYCVVILMGARLISALYTRSAAKYFSPATIKQIELSRLVSAQIAERGLDAMAEVVEDVLRRNTSWVAAARNFLIDVSYSADVNVDGIAVAQRKAYDACRRGQFELAEKELRAAEVSTTDQQVKGWLLEQVAAAVHSIDKVRSQQILAAANERNRVVTKPLSGIVYKRVDATALNQAQQAQSFIRSSFPTGGNPVVLRMEEICDGLAFREDGSDEFEQSLMDLGLYLGFRAQRPEREGVWNLDVLWAIGKLEFVLLPCKSESKATVISKNYTDEVSGAVNWFKNAYDQTCKGIPVLVHRSRILDKLAAPPADMRVISESELAELRTACKAFAVSVKDRLDDLAHIQVSLSAHGLAGSQVVQRFSVVPKVAGK